MEEGNKSGAAACWQGCLPSSIPQQPGPAPAPLPGWKCHARLFILVNSLCSTSVEQREGSGPGIGLNGGKLYVSILWVECGSGPLLLPAVLSAGAPTTGRAGNFGAEEPGAGPAARGQPAHSIGLLLHPAGLCRLPRCSSAVVVSVCRDGSVCVLVLLAQQKEGGLWKRQGCGGAAVSLCGHPE